MKQLLLISLMMLIPSSPVFAQPANGPTTGLINSLAAGSGRLTVSIVRGAMQRQAPDSYIAPADQGLAGKSIQKVVDHYKAEKARLQGDITIEQGVTDGIVDIAAAAGVYASAGTAALPVMILRSAVQSATDDHFGKARAEADESMRAYLARNQANVIADAKLSYEDLRTKSPDEIKALLDDGSRAFMDLDRRVSDPAVREMAHNMLVTSIINTSKATLDQLKAQGVAIGDLNGRVGKIQEATQKLSEFTINSLQAQSAAIAGLGAAVQDLDDRVTQVQKTLTQQQNELDVVRDFAIARMSPLEKVAAIRNGAMDGRFACADGGASCPGATLKEQLIDQYEAEAKVQSFVQTTSAILQNVSDIATIAHNIGVESGPLVDVVNYGTVAVNAFVSVASGNYIGAVAQISGLFASKGPDPQTLFLQAAFTQVNKKLDEVLQNQRILSDQVDHLENTVNRQFQILNIRVDDIEMRIERVRRLQSASINEGWQACARLYSNAVDGTRNGPPALNPNSNEFPSTLAASSFARDNADVLEPCSSVISTAAGSIASADWFGNVLSADRNVGVTDADLDAIDKDREDLWLLLTHYAEIRKIPLWQIYRMLAAPSVSYRDLNKKINLPISTGNPCDPQSGGLAKDRLRNLLCESVPSLQDASTAAEAGLKAALLPSRAIDIAGWILVEQSLVDVHAVRKSGALVTDMDMIKDAASQTGISKGERHTLRALLTLDAAIANSVMAEGDVMIEAVRDALGSIFLSKQNQPDVTLRTAAARVLANHPYLAENVGAAVIRRSCRLSEYETALKLAEDHIKTGRGYEYDYYGARVPYFALEKACPALPSLITIDDKNKLSTEIGADNLVIAFPLPETFKNTPILYSPTLKNLVAMRQRVGERLLEPDPKLS